MRMTCLKNLSRKGDTQRAELDLAAVFLPNQ